ncbi:MAG: ATP-dependent zinc metalloprotease FtsH [Candidatus Moranbacteria bacterium]|nr:ATP-dependent zinc metalloprotease FtsH [Candidatus Moranbacteria bacterium]
MKNFLKNLGVVLLVFLVISGIVMLFNTPAPKTTDVTLNELASQINDGKVKSIEVNGDSLSIALDDDTQEKSRKEAEAALTESLKNYGVDPVALRNVNVSIKDSTTTAFWINTVIPFLLPFIIIGVFLWYMMRSAQRGNNQALSFGLSKARLVSPQKGKKKITFSDVAGAEEAKEELKEIVEFLKHPKKFLDLGARIPKGVLLLGPPGTGKTLISKAVAGEANVPFFSISGSEFVEMFVGVGASRVRDLFKQAKKSAPAIVFIDEIDAVGRHRGAGLGGGHDEREQTLNQILVEMDGFETDTNVIVIAATNRPDVLDPALLRPGRFDRRVVLDLPDIKEREAILKIHSKSKPVAKEVDLKKIAARTPGFSGADIANLVNEAAILAARRGKKVIEDDELRVSIEKVILGPERKSKILNVKEKEVTAYHEAGHALIASSLKDADPVQKVSIISRGQAAGYTLNVPQEDKRLYTRAYFIDELSVLLGGYVSEKLTFGDVTTGASNDLERATNIARNLVTRYGMSNLGPRTFGHKEELVFLGKEIGEDKNYSEATAKEIDEEVSRFMSDAYKTSEKILTDKKETLERISKTLLEKETLEQEEFNELLENPSKESSSNQESVQKEEKK